jgi:hypothetical protein
MAAYIEQTPGTVFRCNPQAGRPYSYQSAASANPVLVQQGPCTVALVAAINTTANLYWLKVYDMASTPVAGAGTPVMRIPVPASATGAGLISSFAIALQNGFAFTITGGTGIDSDTTSAATGVTLNFTVRQA